MRIHLECKKKALIEKKGPAGPFYLSAKTSSLRTGLIQRHTAFTGSHALGQHLGFVHDARQRVVFHFFDEHGQHRVHAFGVAVKPDGQFIKV